MAKSIIFYFSGTGNSLKVARDIASGIGECELVSMSEPYKLSHLYERIGFVYPIYYAGMPRIVEKFIRNLDISQNQNSYIFAISTSGRMSVGLPQLSKLISENGGKLSYGENIVCFANYICFYQMGSNVEEKVNEQNVATKIVVADIQNKKTVNNFKKSPITLMHGAFIKTMANKDKGFHVNDDCTSCAICSKVCPVANIVMKDGKPVFQHHCEQCVACIQWCPTQAINYKNRTQSSGRYHHPDIEVKDIVKK